MHIENLVKMANDISAFFQAEPKRELAVHAIADHLKKFWDPRMRKQIIAHYRSGGAGMAELTREAVKQLTDENTSIAEVGDG
ncbi:MAG: formate dehydrogenase subunit delta [Methylococcaceae bacterium]|nr:formate dehydrogenase subunit delta [Methylococcaceae bacterium]